VAIVDESLPLLPGTGGNSESILEKNNGMKSYVSLQNVISYFLEFSNFCRKMKFANGCLCFLADILMRWTLQHFKD
jgi:hypothetical protein